MGRIAGVPNKITKEVKEKIQDLVLKSIDSIDFNELSAIQKIKLIQIGVQYIIPRLKYSEDFMIDESNKTSVNFRELFNFEKNKLPN